MSLKKVLFDHCRCFALPYLITWAKEKNGTEYLLIQLSSCYYASTPLDILSLIRLYVFFSCRHGVKLIPQCERPYAEESFLNVKSHIFTSTFYLAVTKATQMISFFFEADTFIAVLHSRWLTHVLMVLLFFFPSLIPVTTFFTQMFSAFL